MPDPLQLLAAGSITLLGALPLIASEGWTPVPLITAESRAAGNAGGEGCQWPTAIAVDRTGEFVLFGTDVGGLFRSLDGGRSWEPCNVGYTPRGTACLAIDPGNPERVLSLAMNSSSTPFHGIFLSTDRAASWKRTLPLDIANFHNAREQLAFDPASWDATARITRRVYWSRTREDKAQWGELQQHPAFYRSEDGGETWTELADSAKASSAIVRVHPTAGIVYAANPDGLYVSADHGDSWRLTFTTAVTGCAVVASRPEVVWLSTADGIWRSADRGITFARIGSGPAEPAHGKGPLKDLQVSPADPQRMTIWREGENWQWKRYVSHDGGETWIEAVKDARFAFMPDNVRQHYARWHPTDPAVAWSTGGDWPTKSTDGGRTWAWSGNGQNAIMVGGYWNFSTIDPEFLFVGSQDYNGAVTSDAGATWRYAKVSDWDWGGYTYGAYGHSPSLLVVGNADSWGGTRHLRISRDGGTTFTQLPHTFASADGGDVSFGDPADPQVVFASNLRTADGGATWTAMAGCDAVLTADFAGDRALYGRHTMEPGKRWAVVVSRDHGATWQTVAESTRRPVDIAVGKGRVWIAGDGPLLVLEHGAWREITDLPADADGARKIVTVAVDPVDPSVVYAGSNRGFIRAEAGLMRSIDDGRTWISLTRKTKPLDGTSKDGGYEVKCVRVHPRTREAWISTCCHGMWKYAAP